MVLTLSLQTSDTATFYGKDALVYGWGTTSAGGSSSSVLLEVNIDIRSIYNIYYCRSLDIRSTYLALLV